MAYRFSNTDKWSDSWFSSLNSNDKLLFLYICDNCDIAGFIEYNIKLWSFHTGLTENAINKSLEGASKGLGRGLIKSNTNDCFYVRNFLKHQKNLPLNPKNKAHIGILKRFEIYSYKFDIHDVNEFIQGASKGLHSPTGNGNGIDKVIKEPVTKYKYSEFYDSEIEKANDETYTKFVKWIFGSNAMERPFTNVLSLKEQMSYNNFKALTSKYDRELIKDKIESLENSTNYTKNRVSLYMTIDKWCKRK